MFLLFFFFIITTVIVGWRYGLFFFILVGFLQDPIRKAMAGQPVVITVSVMVVFACIFAIAVYKNDVFLENGILRNCPDILFPLQIFVLIVSIQALRGYMFTGSVITTLVGIASYSVPVIGVLIGFYYVRSIGDIISFMKVYLIIATLFVSTVWLEWLGYAWSVFGTVGMTGDWLVHSGWGHYAPMLSGLMRSGEVASWHGITAAIIGIVIILVEEKKLLKYLYGSMSFVCFLSIVITARRKAIAIGYIFLVVYPFFAIWFKLDQKKHILKVIMVVVIILGVVYLAVRAKDIGTLNEYLLRTESIATSSLPRMNTMFGSILSAWRGGGISGIGVGALSQGSQHFLSAGQKSKIWAESGFGKVLGELGLIGAVILIFLLKVLSKYMVVGAMLTMGDERATLIFMGFVALFVSYIFAFFASGQIFGDPFVFSFISILIGFSLSPFKLQTGYAEDERPTLTIE